MTADPGRGRPTDTDPLGEPRPRGGRPTPSVHPPGEDPTTAGTGRADEEQALAPDGRASSDVIDLRNDAGLEEEPEIDLRDGIVAAATLASTRAATRAVSGRPLDLAPGLTLVSIDEPDDRWAQTERFVYRIYREAGYCAESDRAHVEELQGWEHLSRLQVVFGEDGDIIGTARGVVGTFEQLPMGKFARTDDGDVDPVGELSALAVAPSARGISVVVHLCRAVFIDAWRKGANALMFAIDDWMVELLADSYALPIRPIGIQELYMGGDITPAGMTLRGSEFEDCARRNPGYWQWMTEGFSVQEIIDYQLPIVLDTNPSLTAPGRQDRVVEPPR